MIPVALNLCNDTLSRPSPDIQDAHCKKKKPEKLRESTRLTTHNRAVTTIHHHDNPWTTRNVLEKQRLEEENNAQVPPSPC